MPALCYRHFCCTDSAEVTPAAQRRGGAEAQLEAEMRVYAQYVLGMLTNLESLPLGRIHNMLRMFVPGSGADRGYDRTEAELQGGDATSTRRVFTRARRRCTPGAGRGGSEGITGEAPA